MKRMIRWLPSILWMAVIFYLSSRRNDAIGASLAMGLLSWPPAAGRFGRWTRAKFC